MTPSPSVVVVGGGTSDEHDVSLASAAGIASALDPARFTVTRLTIERDGSWSDAAGTPLTTADAVAVLLAADVLFPALHGTGGEDGAFAGFAQLLGLAAVGSPVRAGAIGMDKWTTKLVARELGLRVAAGELVHASDAAPRHPLPLVVKPNTGGSSNGVSVVRTAAELRPALELALADGGGALLEEFQSGRELDIAVLERADGSLLVSPPLEISTPAGGVFGSDLKYGGQPPFTVPAEINPAGLVALEQAALALFRALGCRGIGRFDFFLTADGLVLNEVNTMPGFTPLSQVPRMFAAARLSYAELVEELVLGALRPAPVTR
ncbi:D-alanine--D-alanine ligase family protein [Herbiconiux sp. SYSU D00978]|uniref:D-alanine--D-alanine ligase family protein n=1 Tax=Herbiconiux sp. SYSU D00978 TaxID=2812562 RepID=UPI001A957D74|nr:ATP-grasp domain-containing protein [Herbiconiux sp. SYSU D00978]